MNQYELCVNIRNRMALKAAEICEYHESWGDEYCVESIRNSQESILKDDQFTKINPTLLTKSEMEGLGFKLWDKASPMMLIPLWLLPYLVDEFEGGCISSDDVSLIKKADIDNDHRFGCISKGVIPSDS